MRAQVFNASIDVTTRDEAVERLWSRLERGERGWVSTINVAMLVTMREDERLQRFVDRAALVVPDGEPLRWVAPLFGGRLPERVTGIDLIEALCERAARHGRRVYLLGAEADTVAEAARRLRERHRELQVHHADGWFADALAAERADAVRAAGADILFVGMGMPRQERFIESQWQRLGCAVAIGVGGSFEVLAGRRLRAPTWAQRAGLEWLVRLAQEPGRLLARYACTNTRFCMLVGGRLLWHLRHAARERVR